MAADASPDLITALKASLADEAKGWSVQAVRQRKDIASVSGSVAGAIAGVAGHFESFTGTWTLDGGGGSVTGTTTSAERLRTSVELVAGSIVHGAAPMRLTYSEVKVGGSFSEAFVEVDGSELRSTDAVLNTTIIGLAAAFQAARDAALIEALDAPDPLELSDGIAEGLIASLADEDARWVCTSSGTMPFYGGAGGIMRSISLYSPAKKVGGMPAQIQYQEQAAIDGTLIVAQVTSAGGIYRTRNADLRAAIMARGATFSSQLTADLESAFA